MKKQDIRWQQRFTNFNKALSQLTKFITKQELNELGGLIKDGDRWMDMVENRKLTFHTYNEEVASNMVKLITQQYFQAFTALQTALADKVDSK